MGKSKFLGIHTVIIITALVGLLSGATVGVFLALTRDLPQIRQLENFEPSAVTRVYSSDGVLLAEWYLERRTPVSIDQIPDDLKAALITTEDRKFYSHPGIDLKGILRAIIKDIMAGHFVEGASTITQQLAKTLFLTPEKTITRKIREALLAIQLERRYTKDELLALYLNQIYFGSGAYGVESAAQLFFGIPASQMDLAQCALIAGLPKAPSRYSPRVNPDRARKRRDLVLGIMRSRNLIDDTRFRRALGTPVQKTAAPPSRQAAPYFIQAIKAELESTVGPSLLYKGGLTVHTTLSHRLQQAAEQAVENGLTDLAQRMPSHGDTPSAPQAGLVAIDVSTGGILAMVGGRHFTESAFNRATQARRQPGSAFKPLVYALAVTRGFTQSSRVLDAPVAYQGRDARTQWVPENFSRNYQGEMTLRYALTHSKNIPAVRLAEQLGPSAVVQFAHAAGIRSPLSPNLSLALGSDAVNLLELTAAYAIFPNVGNHISPYGVIEIQDRDGKTHWRARPAIQSVMTDWQAAIMVDMLQGVIREGTGRRAGRLTFPVAGKTGTTNDCKDALFVGFSPRVAAGVWVGMDDFSSLGKRETGARAALPIWIDFMTAGASDAAPRYFDIPDNMHRLRIDPVTGRAAGNDHPGAVSALFLDGTQPAATNH